jgi:hypothetical protein
VDAGQVAGLLVLLGVVGVLTAIVGSGIEAGPVKFPSIPGSRQKPLAVVSVLVVAGGIFWWAVQRQAPGKDQAATTNSPPPTGALTVSLIPLSGGEAHVGDDLKIGAEVFDSNNDQLGTDECELDWSDSATNWTLPTRCGPSATERSLTNPGVHHITVKAIGVRGLNARGRKTIAVTVRR